MSVASGLDRRLPNTRRRDVTSYLEANIITSTSQSSLLLALIVDVCELWEQILVARLARCTPGFPVALEKFWAVRPLEYRHGAGTSHLYRLLTS
jgi:hypothetical protein